ncbi:MAG: hypothetical protein IJE77_12870, partial [Thermoguttaceae bacterium]|nr:hypothetical protein [Thermoguttaceae bacterium]
MKRTAKNERTKERNATKRRRDREEASRPGEFSRAFRRSTAALALTCGVCVVVAGCRAFGGADDERFRQGRGEYALNDEAVLRDWERAAREAGETAQNGGNGEKSQKTETARDAGKDPASSRPVLRSAAFDEDAERRVVSRKPIAGAPTLKEPEAPKSFSERVKGLFSFPKKETKRSFNANDAERFDASRNTATSVSGGFARSGNSDKTARSTATGFSLGRGLPNVFASSKRRGREKFPVDPVLQYDESRFMPSFQTCQQYYSPLKPRAAVAQPSTSFESTSREKAAQTARTNGSVAKQTRRQAATRVSGRELVAHSEKRRAGTLEDAFGAATSGGASKASTTGWGKTRPIAVAANEESVGAKAPVASVGYLNAARKEKANFQALTARCDGFFGWESDDEALLDAIAEPTEKVGERLTAYATAPTPTPSAFPVAKPSAFATAVAEIATTNERDVRFGEDAATLTAYAPTQD